MGRASRCEALAPILASAASLAERLGAGEPVAVPLTAQLLELAAALVALPEQELAADIPHVLPLARARTLFSLGVSEAPESVRTIALRVFLLIVSLSPAQTFAAFLSSPGTLDALLAGLSDRSDARAAVMYALALRALEKPETAVLLKTQLAVDALDAARPTPLTLQMHLRLKGNIQL